MHRAGGGPGRADAAGGLPSRVASTAAYFCEQCFLAYREEVLAQKCEDHCKTYPSCDMMIGRQAIGSVDPGAETR